jgi:hypothetical protein
MAYSDVALLAVDLDFAGRVTAAYSTDTVDVYPHANPQIWQRDHAWQVASAPGFGDAYASAIAGGVVRPGYDASVISDAQILSAVQLIIAQETPEV